MLALLLSLRGPRRATYHHRTDASRRACLTGDHLSRNNKRSQAFPLGRSTQPMEFRSVASKNLGAVITGGNHIEFRCVGAGRRWRCRRWSERRRWRRWGEWRGGGKWRTWRCWSERHARNRQPEQPCECSAPRQHGPEHYQLPGYRKWARTQSGALQ